MLPKYEEHGQDFICADCLTIFKEQGSTTTGFDMAPHVHFGRAVSTRFGASHWFPADSTVFPSKDGNRVGDRRWHLRGDDGMGADSGERVQKVPRRYPEAHGCPRDPQTTDRLPHYPTTAGKDVGRAAPHFTGGNLFSGAVAVAQALSRNQWEKLTIRPFVTLCSGVLAAACSVITFRPSRARERKFGAATDSSGGAT